ncbi:JmjC domain-containing histone demethylation protein 1 [Rhodotorula kratochvilovae]
MAASTPASARTTSTAKRAAAAAAASSPPSAGRPRRAAHDKNPFSAAKPAPTPPKKKSASPHKKKAAAPAPSNRDSPPAPPDHKPKDGNDTLEKPEHERHEPVKDEEQLKEADKAAQDSDGRCPACSGEAKGDDGTWVECDNHWNCVAGTSSDSPENIDKWYCSSCIAASASSPTPLKVTYKPSPLTSIESSRAASPSASTSAAFPAVSTSSASSSRTPTNPNLRKSSRSTRAQNIDYANLDQHLPASVDRWIKTISAREASGQIVDGFEPLAGGGGGFRRFEDGHELEKEGDEWVYGEKGMTEPFVVHRADGLGLQMPPRLTVKEVAELVGPKTPLEVIDCASQSSLSNWTLGQWADYYEDPTRDKVRNVISLEVSDSRLGEMVRAPELVRKLDWVDTVWPADMKVPGQYPRVQKYCLMSVEKCWTDWHVDFAGSSVFYHVLRGGKTFFFIRPTPANLKAYEEWSGSSERQEATWLGDMVDKVYRMDLKEGNTAFIPTGWIHAVYTPADSLVIGGNFLHSLNITTQLRVYNIELATKVPRKFRYPHFVKLLWLVGAHYHALYTSHPPGTPLPLALRAPRVLDGLKELSSFLIEQTTRLARGAQVSAERRRLARENIPAKKIPDPVGLSREFRKAVLKARGEPFDEECFLPHVAYVDEPPAASEAGACAGTKRKADALLEPDANAALAALSKAANKMQRRPSSGAAPAAASAFPAFSAGDGEIIGRQTLPVETVTRTEERIDPRGQAKHGALQAEVRESRSTQSVIRRWEVDPAAGPGGGGSGPVVETRTVITIVERVRFPSPAQAKLQAAQRRAQPYAAPAPSSYAQQQAPGIGPPAPLSVTAVPGTQPPQVGSSNPQPYQPYGWPYQYQLPAPGAPPTPPPSAAASAPPQPQGWSLSSQGAAALPHPSAALPPLPAAATAMPPPPLPLPPRQGARPPSAGTGAAPHSANGMNLPTPPQAAYAAYPPPPALAPAQQQGYALPLPVPPVPTMQHVSGLPQISPAPPGAGGGLGAYGAQQGQ